MLDVHAYIELRTSQTQNEEPMSMQASAQGQLRQFVEQLERLEDEKRALAADIRDKFLEAKAMGFDPKVMKKVLALRRKSRAERTEEELILDTYLHALDMAAEPVGA